MKGLFATFVVLFFSELYFVFSAEHDTNIIGKNHVRTGLQAYDGRFGNDREMNKCIDSAGNDTHNKFFKDINLKPTPYFQSQYSSPVLNATAYGPDDFRPSNETTDVFSPTEDAVMDEIKTVEILLNHTSDDSDIETIVIDMDTITEVSAGSPVVPSKYKNIHILSDDILISYPYEYPKESDSKSGSSSGSSSASGSSSGSSCDCSSKKSGDQGSSSSCNCSSKKSKTPKQGSTQPVQGSSQPVQGSSQPVQGPIQQAQKPEEADSKSSCCSCGCSSKKSKEPKQKSEKTDSKSSCCSCDCSSKKPKEPKQKSEKTDSKSSCCSCDCSSKKPKEPKQKSEKTDSKSSCCSCDCSSKKSKEPKQKSEEADSKSS
ncbi:putative mucin protein, partial [Cryptosporidium canis]